MNRVVCEGLKFPEGPAFGPDGDLYVVEIQGGQISRVDGDGNCSVFATTGGGPNGANFGPDGNLYVCNNGGFPRPDQPSEPGRVERVFPDGRVEVLISEVDGKALASPNDLAFDADGNFYFTNPVFGSSGLDSPPPGSVCFSDLDGNARQVHHGLLFPNGIGVAPDGKTLIVAESSTFKLHAFDIIEPGVLGEQRLFGDLGDGAVPDGFAFDRDGNVLCCGFSSGKIHVFPAAGGEKLEELEFDDARVTNVAFGGPDFSTLFVTESGLGRVVARDWHRPGMVLYPDR